MGRVTVAVKLENLEDLYDAKRGRLELDQVRTVEIEDALVDTGATGLSISRALIDQLGLSPVRERNARTSAGPIVVQMYEPVRLTILGRDCLAEVSDLHAECPALIGQIPLENLDFVVDVVNHQLIGNPAHGGEHILELY